MNSSNFMLSDSEADQSMLKADLPENLKSYNINTSLLRCLTVPRVLDQNQVILIKRPNASTKYQAKQTDFF